MQVIEKPTILITSLGRTGTDFFAKLFAHVLPNCTSLHEPDIIQNVGVDDILDYIEEVIKYNKEEEMKAQLLSIKLEELKVLFHNNSLETLKTLEFNLTHDVVSEPENEMNGTEDSHESIEEEVK